MKMLLEELGKGLNTCLEVEIDYDYTPGEPMVRYYADGSGYPGSDPYFEVTCVTVLKYTTDTHEFNREDRPDWFKALDEIALNFCQESEYVKESLLESDC